MDATKNAVEGRLANLEWMIRDAKNKVVHYSEEVARRAQQATEAAKQIEDGEAYSLSWIGFMESELRSLKEAEAELLVLVREEKVLQMILRAE